MAYTVQQLEALKAAFASGALRVTYDGRTVEYRSLDDLARAIGTVEAALAAAAGTAPIRQVRLSSRRGL